MAPKPFKHWSNVARHGAILAPRHHFRVEVAPTHLAKGGQGWTGHHQSQGCERGPEGGLVKRWDCPFAVVGSLASVLAAPVSHPLSARVAASDRLQPRGGGKGGGSRAAPRAK